MPWNDQMTGALLLGRKAERELGFFDLEKRRLYSSLAVPKEGLQESWRGTFNMGIYRTRRKGFKLREGRSILD